MKDYRIAFEKRGRVRYISHLDLNRCMLRAVRRSGLPAWYTEGFHPHMYLMFPLALSLGTESICEVMDIRLTEEVPAEEIRVLAYDGDIKPIVTLPLSAVPDCYNLMLHRSPLCLTRQTGDAFQIVWPEQSTLALDLTETLDSRDGDELIFSKWYEDPEYREELVIRRYPTGEVLERANGTLMTMPDGQRWLFT